MKEKFVFVVYHEQGFNDLVVGIYSNKKNARLFVKKSCEDSSKNESDFYIDKMVLDNEIF